MGVAQPLPIGFSFVLWKLPPLALPRLLVKGSLEENFRITESREVQSKS